MVSPPILRYLFALSEPGNGACLFRFLALSYRKAIPKEDNFHDTPA
jgi:hypothetical protein